MLQEDFQSRMLRVDFNITLSLGMYLNDDGKRHQTEDWFLPLIHSWDNGSYEVASFPTFKANNARMS